MTNKPEMVLEGDQSGVVIMADCKHCGKANEWIFGLASQKFKQDNKIRPLPTMIRGTDAAADYVGKRLIHLGYKSSFNRGDFAVFTRHGWIAPDEKGDNGLSIFRKESLDKLAERIAGVQEK